LIARPLPGPEQPKRSGTRAGRGATTRRRSHTRRLAYRDAIRVIAAVSVVTVAVMAYLGLLANATKLHYQISVAQRDRSALEAQTQRLDERVAQLAATDRLEAIAAKLQMRDPHSYAVVGIPQVPQVAEHRDGSYALLGALTGLHH
jgi:cell division protein FtsL